MFLLQHRQRKFLDGRKPIPHRRQPANKNVFRNECKSFVTTEDAIRPGPDLLRQLPLLSALDHERLLLLNEAGDLARIGPAEDVLRQGQVSTDLIFLISGYLAAHHTEKDGQRRITDVVAPIRLIGCSASLLGLPSTCGYRTISSVRLALAPVGLVQRFIQDSPAFAQALAHYLLHSLQETEDELRDFRVTTTAQRLARYLLGLVADPVPLPVRFTLPFEKQYLAGKIGCTQESLSRIFALLRRHGVETAQSGLVVIRDVARLRAFAESRKLHST